MKRHEWTEIQEKRLKNQVISLDGPGTILRDFEMLLDFVGSRPIEAAGKYNLLPIKFISELDERLSRPLRLELKRPQIKSHPYIQGLNLLIRASGLSRIDGTGAKARLVIEPAMKLIWDRLNPTERYFNLLEAWFRLARKEMVGELDRFSTTMGWTVVLVWESIPAKGFRFDLTKPGEFSMPTLYGENYQVALMDLFGLVTVEHSPEPVTPWSPLSIKTCPFGDALLSLISTTNLYSMLPEDFLPKRADGEVDDESESEPVIPDFGVWQALFQPYFPEWRENLEFPELEFQDGVFIFRVSYDKIWRRLAIPAEKTLADLLDLILKSVKFDHDHLYEFTFRDMMGVTVSFFDPRSEEGPWADEYEIGGLQLKIGQPMELLYDYGDSWKFQIKLERIEPLEVDAQTPEPRILESQGKNPRQYPDWEGEDEDEDDCDLGEE